MTHDSWLVTHVFLLVDLFEEVLALVFGVGLETGLGFVATAGARDSCGTAWTVGSIIIDGNVTEFIQPHCWHLKYNGDAKMSTFYQNLKTQVPSVEPCDRVSVRPRNPIWKREVRTEPKISTGSLVKVRGKDNRSGFSPSAGPKIQPRNPDRTYIWIWSGHPCSFNPE